MKSKKKSNLSIVLILFLLISVGFATLTTTLQINGLTKIKGNTWDVYFENVVVKDGSVEADEPEITDKTTITYEVELEKPGDFFEFDVDVNNNGSIDAMIDTITNTELTDSQKEYLEYTVTGIEEKGFLGAKSIKKVNVKVSFKDIDDATKLPSEAQPVDLKLSFDVIQADENAVKDTVDETNNG